MSTTKVTFTRTVKAFNGAGWYVNGTAPRMGAVEEQPTGGWRAWVFQPLPSMFGFTSSEIRRVENPRTSTGLFTTRRAAANAVLRAYVPLKKGASRTEFRRRSA